MTTEQKAKAYDEALERARMLNSGKDVDVEAGTTTCEYIFPELKENEDERIIEQIKFAVMQMPSDREDTKKECLAWLEKQKINTEGDFGRGYDCGYKACLNSHGAEFFEKQKEQKPSINIDQLKSLMLQYLQEAANEKDDEDIEADTDKWARKILEYNFKQKPIEWSEEDERMLSRCIKSVECSKQFADSETYKAAKDVEMNWLKSLKLKPKQEWSEEDEENLNMVLDMVKYCSVVPPEDIPSSTGHLRPTEKYKKELTDWLKSLKDRGNSTKSNTNSPSEWSEEDEHRCKDAIYFLETTKMHYADTSEIELAIDWLKSLRPSWKPSEEQMKALLNAEGLLRKYRHIAIASKLAELYEELKKLGVKEEPEYYQHFDPDC